MSEIGPICTVNTTPLEVTVMYTKATATYRMKKKEAAGSRRTLE